MTTTAESIEILAQFESWREDTLLAGPDVSLTAYIRVLEAGQVESRTSEAHMVAAKALNTLDSPVKRGMDASRGAVARDALCTILKLTGVADADLEAAIETVEAFKF